MTLPTLKDRGNLIRRAMMVAWELNKSDPTNNYLMKKRNKPTQSDLITRAASWGGDKDKLTQNAVHKGLKGAAPSLATALKYEHAVKKRFLFIEFILGRTIKISELEEMIEVKKSYGYK